MKSALFVDFDNVFTQLKQLQPEAAERFARHPSEWMGWLTSALALPQPSEETQRRRLLVRRCYLNPNWYQTYRHAFLRAGFEILDCPPVTSQGKTSTDIHMVLDIIELLQHETRCDEFIVFSADADFTPVLRKLRRHDRRTTVLAIGFPSAAYQASADLLIDERLFLRDALGFGSPSPDPATPPVDLPADATGSRSIEERQPVAVPRPSPVAAVSTLAKVPAQHPFQLAETARLVCGKCLETEGLRVRQRDVTYLVRGMQMNGHVFGQALDDENTLAKRLVNQIQFLCEREQKVLSTDELGHIRRWVKGTIEPGQPATAMARATIPIEESDSPTPGQSTLG